MNAWEAKGREMVASRTTEQLLDQWEMTTNMKSENVITIRRWYTDELYKRDPEAFDKWLSGDARDIDLRKYMMGVIK